jgi:hypothetical protein
MGPAIVLGEERSSASLATRYERGRAPRATWGAGRVPCRRERGDRSSVAGWAGFARAGADGYAPRTGVHSSRRNGTTIASKARAQALGTA